MKGNDLKQSALKIQEDTKIIKEFLLSRGIGEAEITQMQANVQYQDQERILRKGMLAMNADSFSIEELSSNAMPESVMQGQVKTDSTTQNLQDEKQEEDENKEQYIISSTLVVRTNNVDLVISLSQAINELLVKNINISNQYNYTQIEYKFNNLDTIKQEMLKEASKKAFELASNFAKDTKSKLGRVKKARQGEFNIHTPNRFEEYMKKIRIENQVEYYLVD